MGPTNTASNMKEYFAAENLWEKKIVLSAHKLNGGGPILREGIGGGEMFEVEWLGG